MIPLKDLLEVVKDKKLSKEQIEDYYADLTHVYSSVCLELADLKKKEALFFATKMHENPEDSDAKIKRLFRMTKEGMRLIDLNAYKSIIPRELSSLKNRIYSLL